MILFSTLSQGWQVWLFCYLGFVSGLIFFVVLSIANYAIKHAKLLLQAKKLQISEPKTTTFFASRAENAEQKQKGKIAKRDKHVKKVAKRDKHVGARAKNKQNRKEKLSQFFAKILLFLTKFGAEIVCIVAFGGVVCGSLMTNLHFNYGLLPPICIIIWVAFFMLSKFFLKSLAKIFLPIYNKYVAKNKKSKSLS